jgi:hypothetical protein
MAQTRNVRQRGRALALQYAVGYGGLRALTRPALIQCSEDRCAFQRNSPDGQISAAWNSTVRVAMHSGNQDRHEPEADSRLALPIPFWIALGTTRRQTRKGSRATGRRTRYIQRDGSNKSCSRPDLRGNLGTKYQSVWPVPLWAAICNTASTCRILFYSSCRSTIRHAIGQISGSAIPAAWRYWPRSCAPACGVTGKQHGLKIWIAPILDTNTARSHCELFSSDWHLLQPSPTPYRCCVGLY